MFLNRNKKLKPFGKSLSERLPKITICDKNKEFLDKVVIKFQDIDQVEIVNGNIFSKKSNAIVSPANSFGDMGGGIDKLIDSFYKLKAQKRVREKINQDFLGELPVGMAVVVSMESKKIPYLVVAPTMRIPGRLPKESINVYLAMRAILVQVMQFNRVHEGIIKSLSLPGLGTGVGGMDYNEAATQMHRAYKNVYGGEWQQIVHPAMAPYSLRK